jgi:hypothetical protein
VTRTKNTRIHAAKQKTQLPEIRINEGLKWSVHLAGKHPLRTAVILQAILFAFLFGWVLFHSLLLSLIGSALIFSSTTEYLLPIHYLLSPRGATAMWGWTRFEIAWDQVKRLIETDDGLRLSPLEKSGKLDAFRGVQLRFDPDNKEKILKLIHSYMNNVKVTS